LNLGHALKYLTRVEMTVREKHSSLPYCGKKIIFGSFLQSNIC
jgi:hypothetical protein